MRGFAKAATRQLSRSMAKPARKAGEDAGDEFGDGVDRSLAGRSGRLGRGLAKGIGKGLRFGLKPVAAATAGVFAAQFLGSATAALASGATKLVQGLGSSVALLPAAALAGAAAFGALKIAVSGVGDALSAGLTGDTEAFNEALEGLSPSARRVAREVVGLKDQLDGLKATVQESFFQPLVGQIRPLAELYLPQTQGLLSEIAQSFGRAGNQASFFLRMPGVVRKVTEAFGNTSIAVRNMVAPLGRLPEILLPLITVGSSFLPSLTSGFGSATNRLAAFMAEAERTGQLAAFIQRGIDSIRSLIDTGAQVGRIFSNIGSIGSQVWGAMGLQTGGVLDKIESLTGQFDRFLKSAKGTKGLAAVFETLSAVVGGFRQTIGRVAGILGDVFGPIMPQILDFIQAFSRLKTAVLGVGLDALEPVLHGIGGVLGGVVLPALTGLANFLADNKPVLQGIGIAILTLLVPAFVSWAVSAGAAALATLAAMAPLLLIGAAIAAFAALVIIHWDTILGAFKAVWNWLKDNWKLVLGFLSLPISLAVQFITSHWDKIKAAGLAVWNWLKNNWKKVLGFITGPIGAAVLFVISNWDKITRKFRAVVRAIKNHISGLVSTFRGLPGRISRAVSGMWDGIKNAFRSAINFVIRAWNNLSFTLPSVEAFGKKIGGQTISTPNLPLLAQGGVVTGPTLLIAGEGGEDEAIAPLSDLRSMVLDAAQMAALARSPSSSAPATSELIVGSDGTKIGDAIVWTLANTIRGKYGGNVQVALQGGGR